MRILYVCHKPPVPNVDGGTFAMRQFADVLSETTACDAFVLATHKHPFTPETKEYLTARFNTHDFEFIHTEIKPVPMLNSLLSGKSYILKRFQSGKLTAFLAENRYDLIICDSLFSLYAVKKSNPGASTRLWLRSHNVEFRNWITLSKQQSFLKKWLYLLQAKQLKREELKLVKSVQLNLCISTEDERIFHELLPGSKTKLLPIHVKSNPGFIIRNRECYFLGSHYWGPNIDSVNYLLKCWSQDSFKAHTLTIAGGFNEMYSSDQIPESVRLISRVDDLEEFLSKQGILVAPSFSGSGIKVKILEALGVGIPVITTEFGAQGITDEAGLIMVTNETQILEAIQRLKTDESYFQQISNLGKSYIQKYHSFAVVKGIIKETLGE
jgi:glycosyltransferase involved in cell wall biosynthesis